MCHIRNLLTILVIVLLNISCLDKEKPVKKTNTDVSNIVQDTVFNKTTSIKEYVNNPSITDTLCIKEIERAKKDIANGKLVYYDHNIYPKRNTTYLKKLCEELNLKYEQNLPNCIVYEGQTEGCYGVYMDKALLKKYGEKFKDKLNNKADSLSLEHILKNKLAITSWYCDEEPKPILNKKDYLETTLDIENLDLKKTELAKTWPAIDLSFIIERNGTISKFYNNNYIPNLKHNEKFEKQLYDIAVDYIKINYPNWKPGTIREKRVRTKHNLRMTFIGK